MGETPEQFFEEAGEDFEKMWETFPVFPNADEHARHKIVAKNAYMAGVIKTLEYMVNRISRI